VLDFGGDVFAVVLFWRYYEDTSASLVASYSRLVDVGDILHDARETSMASSLRLVMLAVFFGWLS